MKFDSIIKDVYELDVEDLENIAKERQLKENECLEIYQCLDAIEKVADIRNILGNRLLNRLNNDLGYIPIRVLDQYLPDILDKIDGLFYSIQSLDEYLSEFDVNSDENRRDRILPNYLKGGALE